MNAKLYVAKSNGVPKFLIVENEIFTLEELNAEEAAGIEEKPVRTYKKRGAGKPKKPAKAKRGGERLCSKCGEPGHTARTCGRESEDQNEDAALAAANGPTERPEMSDEELTAEVGRRVAEGQSSFRIARDLHVSLRKVNEHWPNRTKELANE